MPLPLFRVLQPISVLVESKLAIELSESLSYLSQMLPVFSGPHPQYRLIYTMIPCDGNDISEWPWHGVALFE